MNAHCTNATIIRNEVLFQGVYWMKKNISSQYIIYINCIEWSFVKRHVLKTFGNEPI